MRRPWPTRIRAGSASDRTFNRPRTNMRPRQTNPTDAEVLSHQLSVIRPVPSTSLGSPAFRTRQRRKYPCETNPKLRESFRLRRISSQTSDAPHQSRERQRPDLQSPAHQHAPAPNEPNRCGSSQSSVVSYQTCAFDVARVPRLPHAPTPKVPLRNEPEAARVIPPHADQFSNIRRSPSEPGAPATGPSIARATTSAGAKRSQTQGESSAFSYRSASDLPPIPPGPSSRHQPAVGPRRVPTGATTGAKRTQAPRQPESPRSRPPPTCLRAFVPSCLSLFPTNPLPPQRPPGTPSSHTLPNTCAEPSRRIHSPCGPTLGNRKPKPEIVIHRAECLHPSVLTGPAATAGPRVPALRRRCSRIPGEKICDDLHHALRAGKERPCALT